VPPCPAICKSGHVPPCPMESAPLIMCCLVVGLGLGLGLGLLFSVWLHGQWLVVSMCSFACHGYTVEVPMQQASLTVKPSSVN